MSVGALKEVPLGCIKERQAVQISTINMIPGSFCQMLRLDDLTTLFEFQNMDLFRNMRYILQNTEWFSIVIVEPQCKRRLL